MAVDGLGLTPLTPPTARFLDVPTTHPYFKFPLVYDSVEHRSATAVLEPRAPAGARHLRAFATKPRPSVAMDRHFRPHPAASHYPVQGSQSMRRKP